MEENNTIRQGRHAVWDCHAHLVFVTKYRRGAFTEPILEDCETIMRNVCHDYGCTLEEFNGEDDHVHLLVAFPATIQLSKLVNSLKGVSSRLLMKQHGDHLKNYLWGGHLWSRSYYCGTTGGANLETLKRYVQNQNRPRR
ncbi:IS200/IS605 family transposase [Bifidobacterium longum]|uniref:IS200/IS605 family transposase n=1 Tax=Bifidobacterium longum TaxID=216816 RepID=A0AAW4NDW0_BIFLN|nr:IS200/IS605 family transposase [Bifidobacterium longum]MBU9885103.1 IS200/IS605 family transposase [Bifidobacterium longum]MBV3438092.1 IS200/IS605 family transposase [Bifidobacterium longum]MBV3494884.1 IS200/IS605 family transposase [Bifidobacterium longum]MBV3533006.1 IS200/IS605 family transposase [Bifidobacterium longum]MBV3534236.1 IS200/IS605 family transposase [Bifidobacterium longum]